jgi:hypothetical protein
VQLVSHVCGLVVHRRTEKYYSQHYVIQDQQFEISIVLQLLYESSYKLRVPLILLYCINYIQLYDEPCLSDVSRQYQYANDGPSKIKWVMSTCVSSVFNRFGKCFCCPNLHCDTYDHNLGTPIRYLQMPFAVCYGDGEGMNQKGRRRKVPRYHIQIGCEKAIDG